MRTALGFLALIAIPTWLSVDILLARQQGWWTSSSTPDVLLGVFGLILTVALLLVLVPRGRRGLHSKAPQILALHLVLVLMWSIGEWTVASVSASSGMFHRYTPENVSVFQPDPAVMPGVQGAASHTTNTRGMRGTEVPDDSSYRVLCVGGSTTACLFLDDTEAWPRVLQEVCRDQGSKPLWVGDVGVSGYGTWQHVKLLGYEEAFADIDCVVFLVGINDFERGMKGEALHSSFGNEPVYERSAIYTLAHNEYQKRKQRRQFEHEFSDGRSYVTRRERRTNATLSDEMPDLDEALEQYKTNLRTLRDTLTERGLRVVFMSQPVLWHPDLPKKHEHLLWLGVPDDNTKFDVPNLARGMARFNAAVKEVCEEKGTEFVDMSGMDGQIQWFFDDCHFTEAGSREVARLLHQHFVAHPW